MKSRIYVFISLFLVASMGFLQAAMAQPSEKDAQFMMNAAKGNLMEIQLGQLATLQAESDEVAEFGQAMIEDHGTSSAELNEIAQQKNVQLPLDLDPEQQATVDELHELTGAEFDRKYMREMVKAHSKDVTKFQLAAQRLEDPDLAAWAQESLPVLEAHLQEAVQIAQQLGVDVEEAREEGIQEAEQEM